MKEFGKWYGEERRAHLKSAHEGQNRLVLTEVAVLQVVAARAHLLLLWAGLQQRALPEDEAAQALDGGEGQRGVAVAHRQDQLGKILGHREVKVAHYVHHLLRVHCVGLGVRECIEGLLDAGILQLWLSNKARRWPPNILPTGDNVRCQPKPRRRVVLLRMLAKPTPP
jgi:hypothetical protein